MPQNIMKSWFQHLICGASLKLKKHDRVLIIDSLPYVWVLYLQIQQTKGIKYFLKNSRSSLVVQWIRICLPVQGAWVWSLVQEDSRASEQLNWWATTTEPEHPRTHVPPTREATAMRNSRTTTKSRPCCHSYKKPVKRNRHLGQPKINMYFLNSRKHQKSQIWMCCTLFSEHLHSISYHTEKAMAPHSSTPA